MKTYRFLKLFLAISFLALIVDLKTIQAQDTDDKYLLGPELYKTAIDKKSKKIVVLDVRTPEEYSEGHISVTEPHAKPPDNGLSEIDWRHPDPTVDQIAV